MNIEYISVESSRSTSLDLRAQLTGGEWPHSGAVLLRASEQTAGVGRFGRAWASPRGGLWCTLAVRLEGDGARQLAGLGLKVGVACVGFVRGLAGPRHAQRVGLKWPNDVVIDGRKVMGVLCEVVRRRTPLGAAETWLLIGAGLNANFSSERLPPDLTAVATTLFSSIGVTVDLDDAARRLGEQLVRAVDGPCGPDVVLRGRAMLRGVGQSARVSLPTGDRVEAVLIGLDREGNAVFEQDGSRWPAPSAAAVE